MPKEKSKSRARVTPSSLSSSSHIRRGLDPDGSTTAEEMKPGNSLTLTNFYDVAKWPIFSLLDEDLLNSIKLACVFGSTGNEAIFVTTEDNVFAFGSNHNGCLGLGVAEPTLTPRKIEPLCKQGLCEIAFGSGPHVVAATENGEIYSWGSNDYYQLGTGSSSSEMAPKKISTNLAECLIIGLACGSNHSLALTDKGEVFAWGNSNYGQCGVGSNSHISTPTKITTVISGKQVVSIAAGDSFALAVSVAGEVYSWGYNNQGQLGNGNSSSSAVPCKVSNLNAVVVTQVVCGKTHSVALTDDGNLYTWGENTYGQLGTGSTNNQLSPVRIAQNIGRFIDVAATHCISAAMTRKGKVYMWGQCRGQTIKSPMETRFTCLDDVFACFAQPVVTYRPLTFENCVWRRALEETLSLAFDSQETSDMKFLVEGKHIHVHKALLKIRCNHFRSMFRSYWDEADKDVIEITQFSYPVYRAFLEYLYTDTVSLPPEDAIDLMDLANSYCETHLKKQCERIIKQGINVNNTALLLSASIRYEAKDLETFCFKFAVNHLTEVAQTEDFNNLEETYLRKFIRRAAESGAFKH